MYICGVVHLIFKNIAVENNFSGAIDKMRGVCCATYDSSFGWRKFAAFDINIFDILAQYAHSAASPNSHAFYRNILSAGKRESRIIAVPASKHNRVSHSSFKAVIKNLNSPIAQILGDKLACCPIVARHVGGLPLLCVKFKQSAILVNDFFANRRLDFIYRPAVGKFQNPFADSIREILGNFNYKPVFFKTLYYSLAVKRARNINRKVFKRYI